MTAKKSDSIPEGFTIQMAAVDALPVLFFAGSAIVLSVRFPSVFFRLGALLVILGGSLKVSWKFVIALAHRNIRILNRQMRYLMPCGFLLILFSLIIDRQKWSPAAAIAHILSFPALIFFLAGAVGMACMTIYAQKFSGMDAKANWIEQATNAAAQACIFLGILL